MLTRFVLLLICLVPGFWATADDQVPQPLAQRIIEALNSARPDMQFDDVRQSPIAGLYRVRVNQSQILYASEDGNYMITGDMYQVLPGRFSGVLDEEFNALRKTALAGIPSKDMVVFPSTLEKTNAHLYVFTDIDCGYCRKLHNETVPGLNAAGVEVRYLAFPRAGIDSGSYRKIATAWCAKDQKQALTQLKQGKYLAENVCNDNPVAGQFKLGSELGVTGTPALILADGTLLPGFRTAPELLGILGL